jgi:pilus assembly protein Flp/PilA
MPRKAIDGVWAVFSKNRMKESVKVLNMLKALYNEESGQDLIEYSLIAALIAVACIAAMQGLATALNNEFNKISNSLT